jgi:hypothetical protein
MDDMRVDGRRFEIGEGAQSKRGRSAEVET